MHLLSKDYWDSKDFCSSIFQSLNFIFLLFLSLYHKGNSSGIKQSGEGFDAPPTLM